MSLLVATPNAGITYSFGKMTPVRKAMKNFIPVLHDDATFKVECFRIHFRMRAGRGTANVKRKCRCRYIAERSTPPEGGAASTPQNPQGAKHPIRRFPHHSRIVMAARPRPPRPAHLVRQVVEVHGKDDQVEGSTTKTPKRTVITPTRYHGMKKTRSIMSIYSDSGHVWTLK